MDPISNADRLVLLLRKKLEERAKTTAGGRTAAKSSASVAAPVEPAGVRALAAIDGADERSLRRAVIQNLLADQLAPELVNDAQFQQIVTRVTDTIEEDVDAAGLLTRVVSGLRQT